MKTWFKINDTTICGCSDPKSDMDIFCVNCANFWKIQLDKEGNLPFDNSNDSIEWMNEMYNEFFRLLKC